MDKNQKALNSWARAAVRQMLVRVFMSMSQENELLAKLMARRK